MVKPDLAGFTEGSPTATDPRLVEALIDLLHERGYTTVAIVASADTSATWAENRDVPALADLLGYRFVTATGDPYEIIDLSQDLGESVLPSMTTLSGTRLAVAWSEAHVRIIVPKNRTDEVQFYALALESLIGVLPCVDKDYQYRQRRESGDVVADILSVAPPHFVVIDALRSAHGGGGLRAPLPLETGVLIATTDAILADRIGALKMGLDPWVSSTFRRVVERAGPSGQAQIDGSVAVYDGWKNVKPVLASSSAMRERWLNGSRLVRPWFQRLDPALFPLKHPFDARVNALASPALAAVDENPAAFWLLVLANYGMGALWRWLEAWRVLYDKDALPRIEVPLGINLECISTVDCEASVQELLDLHVLLDAVPRDSNALRWRDFQESVLFDISRVVPVRYKDFVDRVDVSRTIQFMNDYIGGVAVPIAWDSKGRVTHQVERNLYLPQPNYLVLSQAKPIDVTKLEFCEYGRNFRRMFWKTIKSENASARYDDGIVTFSAHSEGTCVTIFGRQLFILPPFWQAMQLELNPDIRAMLVTQAYTSFFRRTLNNLEALCEGRDIRTGKPWLEPDHPGVTAPLPIEGIAEALESFGSRVPDELRSLFSGTAQRRPETAHVDGDGFAHFTASDARLAHVSTPSLFGGVRELFSLWGELIEALGADALDVQSWAGRRS